MIFLDHLRENDVRILKSRDHEHHGLPDEKTITQTACKHGIGKQAASGRRRVIFNAEINGQFDLIFAAASLNREQIAQRSIKLSLSALIAPKALRLKGAENVVGIAGIFSDNIKRFVCFVTWDAGREPLR